MPQSSSKRLQKACKQGGLLLTLSLIGANAVYSADTPTPPSPVKGLTEQQQKRANDEANAFNLNNVINASTVDAEEGDGSQVTGVSPMTKEDKAHLEANARVVKKVYLNKIGLARVNAERAQKNQNPLIAGRDVHVAPIGQDTETDAPSATGGNQAPAAGGTPSSIPTSVDNSTLKYFPPIGNQGSVGSCAQWAGAYYNMTNEVAMVRDWDAKSGTAYRFTPMFSYNFVNNGENIGSHSWWAWDIAKTHGIPAWSEFPISVSAYKTWCTDPAVYRNSLSNRVAGYSTIYDVNTATGMDTLKAHLANGHTAVYYTYINSWVYKTTANDPGTSADDAYVGKNIAYKVTGNNGGHAMTVLGYNDDVWCDINGNGVVDSNEKGAFRIANSWGTGWKNSGFCYVAYSALMTPNTSVDWDGNKYGIFQYNKVWFVNPLAQQHAPKVVARVTLNHSLRNQVSVRVGIGSVGSSTPASTIYPQIVNYQGGAFAFSGAAATSQDFTYYLDFTDVAPSIGTAKRWFVQATDSGSNNGDLTIKNFDLYCVNNNVDILAASATNTPQVANGATKYAYVDWTMGDVPTVVNWNVASQASASESGSLTVTAQLSAVSTQAVTVPFTLSGSAIEGTDYNISASSLTIPAGSLTTSATINILADAIDEAYETVIVTMGTPTNANKGSQNVCTTTITDDDAAPSVAFLSTGSTSASESGTMTVTVKLSAISGQAVTVPFTTSGTATKGTDYTITGSSITIPAGILTVSTSITIISDALDEANETAILTMGTPTNATKGTTVKHTATITDDDAMPSVVFTSTSQTSTAESGTMTVTAKLSVVSGRSVTVPLTLTGTATKGADYTISTTNITIPAGSTTGAATITILDDAFDEANETIIVTIGNVTTATKGTPNVFTGTITDDDGLATPPVVAWTTASQSFAESGTATVTAQLSVASPLPVTVPFTVTGTAASGTDYTISASPLTIPAGSLTASATITVISDALDEANETVILTIGSPTNATKGSTITHTATITDDDPTPTVTFTSTSQTSTSESGTMTVTVQLSAVSGRSVSVPFALTGTATKGTDYTITASPVTIPAGSLTASATITIIADSIDEADETVIMTMGSPTNATKGATTVHTATISDAPSVPASSG